MLSSWWILFQVSFFEEVIRCCSNNNKKLFLLFLCSFTGDFLPEDSINGQVSKLINYFVLLFFLSKAFGPSVAKLSGLMQSSLTHKTSLKFCFCFLL